jgi:membrane protein DedA with SNARE-associated domain
MLEVLAGIIQSFISSVGYVGIFILMALESTMTPVPSELVMPFAGYLAGQGRFSLTLVILIGALGCLAGSLFSYAMGRWLGIPFIKRYGKFFLLNEAEMNWTINWFNKHGEKTIFISRFIPVVRHFISIPAGIAKMNIWRFSFYTFIGSLIWVGFLAYAGLILGENWHKIKSISTKIDVVIIGLIVIGGIVYIYYHIKKKSS